MATKECPSCIADVPSAALRCKHCFHDFSIQTTGRPGPMVLLWALAVMSLAGALVMAVVVHNSITARYVVDATTQSIHSLTTTMTGGTESSSIPFDEIESIEYIEGGDFKYYEVVATTKDDERLLLEASNERQLASFARDIHLDINRLTPGHDVELIETRDDSTRR